MRCTRLLLLTGVQFAEGASATTSHSSSSSSYTRNSSSTATSSNEENTYVSFDALSALDVDRFADLLCLKGANDQKRSLTRKELKQAYRKQAQLHHPDTGGDAVRFQEIKNAYEALMDPAKYREQQIKTGGCSSDGTTSTDFYDHPHHWGTESYYAMHRRRRHAAAAYTGFSDSAKWADGKPFQTRSSGPGSTYAESEGMGYTEEELRHRERWVRQMAFRRSVRKFIFPLFLFGGLILFYRAGRRNAEAREVMYDKSLLAHMMKNAASEHGSPHHQQQQASGSHTLPHGEYEASCTASSYRAANDLPKKKEDELHFDRYEGIDDVRLTRRPHRVQKQEEKNEPPKNIGLGRVGLPPAREVECLKESEVQALRAQYNDKIAQREKELRYRMTNGKEW